VISRNATIVTSCINHNPQICPVVLLLLLLFHFVYIFSNLAKCRSLNYTKQTKAIFVGPVYGRGGGGLVTRSHCDIITISYFTSLICLPPFSPPPSLSMGVARRLRIIQFAETTARIFYSGLRHARRTRWLPGRTAVSASSVVSL